MERGNFSQLHAVAIIGFMAMKYERGHWPPTLNCRCALIPKDASKAFGIAEAEALKIRFKVAVQMGASQDRINSILDEYNQLGQTAHFTH